MKKTIRILSLVLVLALLLCTGQASAASIFPELPDKGGAETAAQEDRAPSYGVMAGVKADEISENADGDTILRYDGVGETDYHRFGTYLGDRGYETVEHEEQGVKLAIRVSNGKLSFVVVYDPEACVLYTVYPRSVAYEVDLYAGYTPVRWGETVKIKGLGEFTFTGFTMDGEAILTGFCQVDGKKLYYYNAKGNTDREKRTFGGWLAFTFYNTATEKKVYGAGANELVEMTVCYLSGGSEYSFPQIGCGAFFPEYGVLTSCPDPHPMPGFDLLRVLSDESITPLSSFHGCAAFDLPDGLRGSTDGTVFVKLTFATGDKIALILREDGVNLT